jgi:signal transduction histidine kinase/ligand-binding sensor domain-containing protein/DNA-binding response OmpR family regulator
MRPFGNLNYLMYFYQSLHGLMKRPYIKYGLRSFHWLIILLFIPLCLEGQHTGTLFTHFNIQNGLIMNNVEYVYIDREGFVWIGTYAGMQRFDGYEFRDFTYDPEEDNSISDNFISSLFEDDSGNLWIGTQANGLDVFNKKTEVFRNFRNEPGMTNSLAGNHIPRASKVITEDREGFIWVNTENGLNRISPVDFRIESYYGDLAGQLIYDESGPSLWIGGDQLKRFDLSTRKLSYYNTGPVKSIIQDSRGSLWLGTSKGALVMDPKENDPVPLKDHLEYNGYSTRMNEDWMTQPLDNFYEDFRDNIWFSTRDQVVILDRTRQSVEVLSHEPDNDNSLHEGTISGIYGNKTGVIWISYLNQGLSKVNINLKRFNVYRNIPGDPNSLSGNAIRSVFKDDREHLWVGTYDHGLNRINLNDNRVEHYRHQSSDPGSIVSDYITAIYVDPRQRLWIGSFENGICYADNIYRPGKLQFRREVLLEETEIHEFTEDRSGKIWISTQYGFYLFDGNEFSHYGEKANQLGKVRNLNIQSVVYEPPNLFWLATWNSGLCRLTVSSDPELSTVNGPDEIEVFDHLKDVNSNFIDNKFITIHRTESGTLWLGSYLNGLIRVDESGAGLRFIKYDKSSGAPDNSVYGLTSDHQGNLWISTNNGLGRFDPETEQFRNYGMSDGLQSNSFIWDSYFCSSDGQLFFGGINGLNVFYPENIVDNTELPKIFISKLIINNENVGIGDEINGNVILTKDIRYTPQITLTHKEPVFSLEFTAMDNINPHEVMYKYRLDGFDEDWIRTGAEQRYVRYTNLNPGTYVFNVMASNSDGVWNDEPASLEIMILPPWWQTWWAILGYSISFALLLLVFRHLILGRAQLIHEAKVEHLEREKTEEMYQMKMRFFTSISHEFRTPLTLVLGPLNKIIKNLLNDSRFTREVATIRRNSDRLFRLIDQVIEFRKIETNKIKLNASEKDIVSFVRDLVDSFEEIAYQRSIDLSFKSEFSACLLWYDENKVDKIVYNLLSNAFKFTPDRGRIYVTLAGPVKIPENGECIELKIEDNGIGISEQDLDHIFDRYFRVEKPHRFVHTGSGIGLSLARELTEMHGGRIEVSSKLGKGTRFSVQLPLGKDHLKEDQIVEHIQDENGEVMMVRPFAMTDEHEYIDKYSPAGPQLDQSDLPLLLIVDDDPELRAFIKNNFIQDYIVIEAENGEEGFEMALKNNPDMIISDIMMPVMDGIELCRKIKSDIKTSHIPLILLTAKAEVENEIEGLDVGADAFVTKPFTIKLIEAQMHNILENRKNLRKKFSKEMILQPTDIAITSIDAELLQKAINSVEKHMSDTEFSVDTFTKEMGMSRSRMHRKLKALTEQSTSEFIRSIRLKRALSLLEKSRMSIEEVAYSVGFNSTAYFTKCFRTQFGKTPSEFIKSNLGPESSASEPSGRSEI